MITISEIALPPNIEQYPKLIAKAIPDIVEEIRGYIINQAHERLLSSSQTYVAGVQEPIYYITKTTAPRSGTVATIILTGRLPNMIEQGWPGGDMKPALLSGRNVRYTKSGEPFNTVPFRHGTPGTTGRNFAPMGSQFRAGLGSDRALSLGRKIYNRAKRLKAGESLPAGLVPLLRTHHVTDIAAGMQRIAGSGRSTQYMTWRRVSRNSKPEAWLHPGIEPRNIFPDAAEYGARVGSVILSELIRGAS